MACWFAWFYPFIFRAPHHQKRSSITVAGPTRIGLALETLAIFLAFALYPQSDSPPGLPRIVCGVLIGALASVMAWKSVTHLGRQFRLHAGLYHDHELVRTGPYGLVRHPIYASLFAMLICTILLLTPWEWAFLPLALFVIGTEIRVRSEDRLLESRFGDEFREYRRHVRAYVPFVR